MKQERHPRAPRKVRASKLSGDYGRRGAATTKKTKRPRGTTKTTDRVLAMSRWNAQTSREFRDVRKHAMRRGLAVAVLFAVGAIFVIERAYEIQVTSSGRYQSVAERQAVTSRRIVAKRGVIKDRHGAELVLSVDVDSIYAEPRRISDPAAAALALAPILGQPRKKLLRKLDSQRAFVFLERRVDPAVAEKVRALDLEGVGIQPEPRRFYANRELGAHLLGFTSYEGEGVAGVERSFDDILKGRSYELSGLRDATGQSVLSEGFVPQVALEGDDLELTIDRQIQHAAEESLLRAVSDNEAAAGVAVVLEVKTGEVLAMASAPSFNPNNLSGSRPEDRLNRAIGAVYEPGSTMKMVTIAAALEEGLVTPNSEIDCENGQWKVGGRTIRDSNHKYGVLSVGDVLKLSSNICSAKIGLRLGRERVYQWLTSFGFGRPTGLELPGELKGLLRPADRWREITLANIAFGQGLSVTPMQIAQAANIIANDGVQVPLRLVRATVDKAGKRQEKTPEPSRRIVSAKTAAQLKAMLAEVTREGGTAPAAAIAGFEVAGKTGTAQKIDPVTRAYSRSLYVASFVGFVPKDDPAVVVLVLIDEPKKSIYGGSVAAPAFREIASAALSALEIYPDDPKARAEFLAQHQPSALPSPAVPSEAGSGLARGAGLSNQARRLLGEPLLSAPEATEESAPPAWAAGLAEVTEPAGEPAGRGEGPLTMPNFAGLSMREVLNRSADARCDLFVRGSGHVVRQNPRAGARIPAGARCEVVLSPEG